MPELPEVETLRQLLALRCTSSPIRDLVLPVPKVARGFAAASFRDALIGLSIAHIGRRGKMLIFTLREQEEAGANSPKKCFTLVVHLKMQGRLSWERARDLPKPYLCAELNLEDGHALRFYDHWRWGSWTLMEGEAGAEGLPLLADMGPEPLGAEFTPEYLRQCFAPRRGPIKPLLLQQSLIAGLGNLYGDECLYHARLHPARPARSLHDEEVCRLHGSIVSVLSDAVTQGTAQARRLAANQANLEDFAQIYAPRIYGRAGQPCPSCGQTLIKFHLSGRSATFCPCCQPNADFPADPLTGDPNRAKRSGSHYV